MILVNGERVSLPLSDELLHKELSYLVAMLKSRSLSKGNGDAAAYADIDAALSDARTYTLDHLRSESKMCAQRNGGGRAA